MKPAVMVIDFGTSKVSCMIAEDNDSSIVSLGAAAEPYSGFTQGRWMSSEQVVDAVYEAVRAAQQGARRRMRECYMVIPGDYVRVVCGKPGRSGSAETPKEIAQSYQTDRYKVIHRGVAFENFSFRRSDPSQRRLEGLVGYVLADTLFLRDIAAIADELG
ncbi:MAG: hypothetical protein FWD16_00835, partial [Clostridia bacterium]|nr:hypothetical protein [Clostridia bacterium]